MARLCTRVSRYYDGELSWADKAFSADTSLVANLVSLHRHAGKLPFLIGRLRSERNVRN